MSSACMTTKVIGSREAPLATQDFGLSGSGVQLFVPDKFFDGGSVVAKGSPDWSAKVGAIGDAFVDFGSSTVAAPSPQQKPGIRSATAKQELHS